MADTNQGRGKVPHTTQLKPGGKEFQPLDGRPDKMLDTFETGRYPKLIRDGERNGMARGRDIRRIDSVLREVVEDEFADPVSES